MTSHRPSTRFKELFTNPENRLGERDDQSLSRLLKVDFGRRFSTSGKTMPQIQGKPFRNLIFLPQIWGKSFRTRKNLSQIWGKILPPGHKRASDSRQIIPTSENLPSDLGQISPTVHKHASDSRQIIPISEKRASDLGQISTPRQCYAPDFRLATMIGDSIIS